MPIPQGDLRLLETPSAQELLTSNIPARVAYVARDGHPRNVPTWFHWTGTALVMATFRSAPHVTHAARRIDDLRANPNVAVLIDTQDQPPRYLTLRGAVSIDEVDGVAPEYASAAPRYMGADAARDYLASLDGPGTAMVRFVLVPTWVGLIDFEGRAPSALGGLAQG